MTRIFPGDTRLCAWLIGFATLAALSLAPIHTLAAPSCPLSYGATDAAKSHKLYLYFPTADDATYPGDFGGESPAKKFDVADLNSAIGTTAALRDRIYDVVADDFCEFNVQVRQTTASPESLPITLRHVEAVGSDNSGGGAWGRSPTTNLDQVNGRVWAGSYVTCEGGNGAGGCTTTGSLTGANATLERWAQAIGGTTAHESGHTYGLNHSDDDPPTGACPDPGPGAAPGEDALTRHLMPAGCNLDGPSRATFRRHVSDAGFGILATNIGLSIQTMHNWDLVNPNAGAGRSLTIEFLSSLPSVNITWSYDGDRSPWHNPVVSGPLGTTMFHGSLLNRYRITWSAANPAWTGPSGTVAGGAEFHVGATFTGVDFDQPDPIIIQNVTLFDASSHALGLHPRLPMYDAGAVDSADSAFSVHFFPAVGATLRMQQAVIFQLPRVASIASMVGGGRPVTFDGQPIRPWAETKCAPAVLREVTRCTIAKLDQPPHVTSIHRLGEPNVYDCSKGVPWRQLRRDQGDSAKIPDNDGPICAGSVHDPFPSTTIYLIATFVDPAAKHWDPVKKTYVVGPVTSKVFYQFAGVRDMKRLREPRPTDYQPKPNRKPAGVGE
jgi:hypothetical protein